MSGTGVSFSEVMKGRLAVSSGAEAGSCAILRARVSIDDLDDFLQNPLHDGSLEGTIWLPALCGNLLPAKGTVQLFKMGRKVGERVMRYRADFEFNGVPHALLGDKYVFDDPGFDAWKDVTKLHAKVVRFLPNGNQEQLWSGVMTLSLFEAARLMTTLRGTGDAGGLARMGGILRFAGFFLREIVTAFLPRSTR